MKNNNFINNIKKPFHSSGYARAAHGDYIGSTSPQSFGQRREIDRSRQAVREYRDSHVVRVRPHVRADIRKPVPERPVAPIPTRQQHNTMPAKQASLPQQPRVIFREPPGRNYNPYG